MSKVETRRAELRDILIALAEAQIGVGSSVIAPPWRRVSGLQSPLVSLFVVPPSPGWLPRPEFERRAQQPFPRIRPVPPERRARARNTCSNGLFVFLQRRAIITLAAVCAELWLDRGYHRDPNLRGRPCPAEAAYRSFSWTYHGSGGNTVRA